MSFQRKLEPHYNDLNIFVIHGGMLLINYTKVPFVKYLSTFYWKFKFYPDTTDSQLSIITSPPQYPLSNQFYSLLFSEGGKQNRFR